MLGYAACDGSAGACLPCPPGLTTAGVGGAGAASCVEPASLLPSPLDTACSDDTRPLSVAGAALCVPERLFPAPDVEHCVFDKTWLDVGEQPDLFTAGWLGKKLTAEWKVWMCAADVPCSAREGDLVCFTFSERHQVFVPWGYNSDLEIIKPK